MPSRPEISGHFRKDSLLFPRLRLVFLSIAIIVCSTSGGAIGTSFSPSESVKKLCEKVANGHTVKFKGTRAEFFDGKHTWTIFGALQEETEPVIRPGKWSVGNARFQILVVKEPISDTPILPFSDPVPNVTDNDSLHLRAWRGEFESGSIVLRSGDRSLEHVSVEVSDFFHIEGKGRIGRGHIDARLVKCWYQAGLNLRRKSGDKKRLTPELLLNDDDLVRVDHENHVNLVRDISNLRDAEVLQSFDVPARMNQQLWFTVQAPINCRPGMYKGKIRLGFIVEGQEITATLPVSLEIDTRVIRDPPIEYALFYLARFDPLSRGLGARAKNQKQMEAEFRDMRAHGLTNVAVDYEYRKTKAGDPNFSRLRPVLEAMRRAGFDTKRFLFVDWGLGGSQIAEEYTRKMTALKRVAEEHGFKEVFVYNNDERDFSDLVANRKTFEIPRQLGLINFVACSIKTASRMEDLLDVAILPRRSPIKSKFCDGYGVTSCIRIIPWAYNDPQAGMETPETYRKVYGLPLIEDGFRGVCNYAYQSGDCWDDWADNKWRPHIMAYPTLTAPVPTLQWEGFREAIDDVRKLSGITLAE